MGSAAALLDASFMLGDCHIEKTQWKNILEVRHFSSQSELFQNFILMSRRKTLLSIFKESIHKIHVLLIETFDNHEPFCYCFKRIEFS